MDILILNFLILKLYHHINKIEFHLIFLLNKIPFLNHFQMYFLLKFYNFYFFEDSIKNLDIELFENIKNYVQLFFLKKVK